MKEKNLSKWDLIECFAIAILAGFLWHLGSQASVISMIVLFLSFLVCKTKL